MYRRFSTTGGFQDILSRLMGIARFVMRFMWVWAYLLPQLDPPSTSQEVLSTVVGEQS